jgi:shikimate kinase
LYPWDGKNIYFMGFMATGKSKVGKELSKLLGWSFADTDSLIEEIAGKSVSRIFGEDGEPHFRQLEKQVIKEVASQKQMVIALGGGAVVNEENWQLLSQSGLTICLNASIDLLCKRIAEKDHRPLMANASPAELKQRVETLLAKRAPFYQKAQYCFVSLEEVTAKELAIHIFTKLRDEP